MPQELNIFKYLSYLSNQLKKIKDLKQINEVQELQHSLRISGYKDQSCEANQFDIIEETKEEIDWALEDFYFIKQAKKNVDQFPPYFEGAVELQSIFNYQFFEILLYRLFKENIVKQNLFNLLIDVIQKRFEDSLIDLLRIFLGISHEDYYDKKAVSYGDLMIQLKRIIKNPQLIVDGKVQGHSKVKILYIFLKDFLPIVQREEQIIEQIKSIQQTLSEQQQKEQKEKRKPSYIRDYEKGTLKQRKNNKQQIFTIINKLQEQPKSPFK